MRVRTYGPLYQLTFLPHFFPVNCYIFEEKEDLTLIDAGLPYSHKGILKLMNTIGKPITRIVLTHAHEDHVGSLDTLKRALPNAKVYISKRDAKIMAHDHSLEEYEAQSPIRGGVPKKLQTKPDVLLQENEFISSLRVIAAPGHTPGLMAFYNEDNGILIAGDAIQTRGGIAVAGKVKLLFPFPAMGTWDKRTSIESAKKLLIYSPKWLAVGHGEVLKDPVSLMKKAIIEAEQALER